jgi:hypothetical protein
VADRGVLIYEPGSKTDWGTPTRSGWIAMEGRAAWANAQAFAEGAFSDGKRFVSMGNPKSDIWVLDLEHGSRSADLR